MVAKSFQNLEVVGEPFTSAGKQYVNVRTKTGALKQVRYYTTHEYNKMYPNDQVKDKYWKPQKELLGFTDSFITIFKGELSSEAQQYFEESPARYNKFWGWYLVSSEPIPDDLPEGIEPMRLDWDLVGKEDGSLKTDAEVSAAVEPILYEDDPSEYQGEIGDKLSLIVIVEKAIPLDGYYGPSTMHIMRDYDGNCYVWTTAAKSWEPNTEHEITGTIKDLRKYKGVKQTVLTRCRER